MLKKTGILFTFGLLGAIFFASNALAATPMGSCDPVKGKTTPVIVGGVPNSGVIDFDNPAVSADYRVCAQPMDDGTYRLEGWAWDDNLGWISFYCDTAGQNRGAVCGGIPYGVSIDTTGSLRGFAWGDNTGGISFSCSDDIGGCTGANTHQVIVSADSDCLGQVYSVNAFPPADPLKCLSHTAKDSHAWSDNLGWFDFTGVVIPVKPRIELDVALTVTPEGPVYADGTSAYELRATIVNKDSGGPTIIGNPQFDVQLKPFWAEDSVHFDQTDTLSPFDFSLSNGGPVTKPLADSDFSGTDGFTYRSAQITSVAPTSAANTYETGGSSYLNEEFVLPKTMKDTPPVKSRLVLGGVHITVNDNVNNYCIFPYSPNPCAGNNLVQVSGANKNLEFKPAVAVSVLDNTPLPNVIMAQNAIANQINTSVDCVSSGGCEGLGTWSVAMRSGLDESSPSGFSILNDENSSFMFPVSSALNKIVLWTPTCQNPDNQCPEVAQNPYLYSTVEYDAKGQRVKYYSAKLPRVTGALVVNPVADIKGSVYSTGVSNPQTGISIKSLGDVSSNLLRDQIWKNVSAIVGGKTKPTDPAMVSSYSAETGFNVSGNVVKLLGTIANPDFYYFGDDVTVDSSGDISWTGNKTIVTVGGDIYIKDNLYNPPSSSNPRLGLVALRDLATGKGGNIYIDKGVTNIQANIYADGSVFSYDSTVFGGGVIGSGPNKGEPKFDSESARYEALKNQLYIEGSISSQNTIGGATRSPAILGDGSLAGNDEGSYGNTPSGRSRARLYDLNFLRYYGKVYERFDASSACPGQAVDQDDRSLCPGNPIYLIDENDLVLIPGGQAASGLDKDTQFSAVYVTFDPPPPTLPGFGVQGNAQINQRVQ